MREGGKKGGKPWRGTVEECMGYDWAPLAVLVGVDGETVRLVTAGHNA